MEGIFEAQNGVIEAISWYAEGSKEDATYDSVSSGLTKHREAVEVIYDPSKISYTTLVDLYYTQIDPTQVDGQFADKGFRYTTAIYYQNTIEKDIIASAKMVLESSHKFDKPIVVQSLPFTTFFPAEEYHQDYYKKSSLRYSLYKKWSGRENFIQEYGKTGSTLSGVVTWNGQYIQYQSWIIQTLTWSRILLFFHADWCSTCKSFDEQIRTTQLPWDLIILQVDYDTADDLKKQYSILSQSTFIQIDPQGNMYKRWLGKSQLKDILDNLITSKDILSKKLTPLAFEVTQNGWTEQAFMNAYWNHYETGIYVDVVDGTPLFSSLDKFDSKTGWPSFTRPIDEALVTSHNDMKLWMERTEIKSSRAGSHLWHVFDDGPQEKGWKRYCMNSAALRFIPVASLEKEGYGKYRELFKGQ